MGIKGNMWEWNWKWTKSKSYVLFWVIWNLGLNNLMQCHYTGMDCAFSRQMIC